MHEAAVVESLVSLVEGEAAKDGLSRVRVVSLVVGELAGYADESVEWYFGLRTKGTVLEGADLVIRHVAAEFLCPACGLSFKRKPFSFACPVCGAEGRLGTTGSEFYVESIEGELPETASATSPLPPSRPAPLPLP